MTKLEAIKARLAAAEPKQTEYVRHVGISIGDVEIGSNLEDAIKFIAHAREEFFTRKIEYECNAD